MTWDIVIVGGGIVGLATAYQCLKQKPDQKLLVFEKESRLGAHQTGHNSGVLHSGIYYKPGSLKAQTCQLGKALMERFCADHSVPFELCGKVIVAIDETEIPALDVLYGRGLQNGVTCRMIDRLELNRLEPSANGIRGLHVPETGIVDYGAVVKALCFEIEQMGGEIRLQAQVQEIQAQAQVHGFEGALIRTNSEDVVTRFVINCGGLYADRLARKAGTSIDLQIIPFRGEYYALKPHATQLCRNLIYPVPNPDFPFLGVHLTRMIEGGVECGPNAVLALCLEGYQKNSASLTEFMQTLGYPGFHKLARRYYKEGLEELWRSFSKRAFVLALKRLVPDLCEDDLYPAPAGVRAQAVTLQGTLVDDFAVVRKGSMLHVLNTPSPAATASLAVGLHIAKQVI